MGLVESLKNVVGGNAALRGGVSPGRFGRERVEDIVCHITGYTGAQKLAQGETFDRYDPEVDRDDGNVSLENANIFEQDLRDVLDGRFPAGNLGWDYEGSRGLTPCDLLRRKGR